MAYLNNIMIIRHELMARLTDVSRGRIGVNDRCRHEAVELKEKLEQGVSFMTTSCCPSFVETVRKHTPGLAPFVSHTPSSMAYTAAEMREKYPGARLV
jgi:iron only hydrogenase large subunit-like protein